VSWELAAQNRKRHAIVDRARSAHTTRNQGRKTRTAVLGEEDGHGSDGLDLPWLGSLLTQTPSLGGGSHLTHPKTWTLRSVMPLRVRVLGVEDDLRTLSRRLIEEVAFASAIGEG
jgi:hypothetical protein